MEIIKTALIGLFALSGMTDPGALVAVQNVTPIEIAKEQVLTVGMTGYNAVPEQTDGDPHITASGAYSNPEVVAARSQDLAEQLPFGTVISITPSKEASRTCGAEVITEHIGLRVIADSMHYRKRDQIDILLPNEKTVYAGGRKVNPAVALGICSGVEIRVVGKVDVRNMPRTQSELLAQIGYLEKANSQRLAVFK